MGDTLVPVSAAIEARAVYQDGTVHVSWKARPAGGTSIFYRVLRSSETASVFCANTPEHASNDCIVPVGEAGVVRGTAFADRPGQGKWAYRIGVAANWVDDPKLGDIYVVSPPVTLRVP